MRSYPQRGHWCPQLSQAAAMAVIINLFSRVYKSIGEIWTNKYWFEADRRAYNLATPHPYEGTWCMVWPCLIWWPEVEYSCCCCCCCCCVWAGGSRLRGAIVEAGGSRLRDVILEAGGSRLRGVILEAGGSRLRGPILEAGGSLLRGVKVEGCGRPPPSRCSKQMWMEYFQQKLL
jgi:hypothetical protein